MNFSRKVMLGSVLLLGASSVFADTADLRVIGTIAPGACTPVFSGGATVDYGVIPISSLNVSATTQLQDREIGYTITCNAPIPISTTWSDSRAGTAYEPNTNRFGLGTHNGVMIGRYNLYNVRTGVTGDGQTVDVIQKNDAGSAWVAPAGGITSAQISSDGVRQFSYAPVGTLVPGAYQTYVGAIRVIPVIAPTDTLNLTTEVTLDGLSTMTVNYL